MEPGTFTEDLTLSLLAALAPQVLFTLTEISPPLNAKGSMVTLMVLPEEFPVTP
jgi:hypothetical protein